ncbi:MAG: hypothetical protein P0Y59_00460 [Candidatus Sphingomonas phytovorans]|nr:hypothetical protein [Sphingomonas sp.]WEK00207.1 MAG: hypothetical protein P0Y59_00460 [Sphingomonas sp.]
MCVSLLVFEGVSTLLLHRRSMPRFRQIIRPRTNGDPIRRLSGEVGIMKRETRAWVSQKAKIDSAVPGIVRQKSRSG